ncbi:BglG family transcription antiterminator [Lactococcus termiticola]|uniref:Ascorbate-specific PTS system EIIA component n=1 Tax=Lactococcus termiticola TaxID=2169526 RepID=A0A2R5HDT5_9LACT|nr:PTS sugar transporter subunit IIA [Lactococcus termiticola]GBG96223.1 phosphoenolpyruvate-dependent sugar phosphotransferase system, EIIA 2 [Lactococcus termiticola]
MIDYDLDIMLFSKHRLWKKERALELLELSESSFISKMKKLNEKLGELALTYEDGLISVPKMEEDFESIRFEIDARSFSLQELDRQAVIFLLIYSRKAVFSTDYLIQTLGVSKNTVLSDLKKLRQAIAMGAYPLELVSSRTRGFYLEGEELELRRLVWHYLQQLSDDKAYYVLSSFLNKEDALHIYKVKKVLDGHLARLEVSLVYSRYIPCLFYFALTSDANENLLLGMSDGTSPSLKEDFLYRMAFDIMQNLMRLTANDFEDFTTTFNSLLLHLGPAYYRLKGGFELQNSLLERIKKDYSELFRLMPNILEALEAKTGKISEGELAYFVVLFGGEIYKEKYASGKLRAIVLCLNGISSSLILKKRLESLFPNIEFILSTSLSNLEMLDKASYDIIFSSVPVYSEKRVYLVSSLPSAQEESELYNQVMQDYELPGYFMPEAEKIYKAILPYIDLKASVSKKELINVINKKLKHPRKEKENYQPMLSELLRAEHIRFTNEKLDWQSAIRKAAEPLLDSQAIEASYPEAIISRVSEYGPYIDLGLGIALPHARPEDGVNKLGMTFLKCEEEVLLNDDPTHKIQVFILLAAVDNESHLRALSSLTQILSDKEELEALKAASTVEEVQKVLSTKEEK